MRVRALLAMSLIVPLFALGGGSVVAHEGDAVVDEIYEIKHQAMAQIDQVVNRFKQDVMEADDQAERNELLAQALQDVEDICKEGVDSINTVVAEHPEQQWAADSAIAYLEDYTLNAEVTLIQKHAKASEEGSTTSTTAPLQPPTIQIATPEDGAIFEEATVLFSGVATPGAQVTVGPYNAATDAEGNWWINLVLNEGRNVARVVATNQAGQATDQVVVFFEPPATTTTTSTSSTSTSTTSSTSTTTTTTTVATTTTTSTTTTTLAAAPATDPAEPASGEGSLAAAFAPLLEGRILEFETGQGSTVLAETAGADMSSTAVMSASNDAFAMIRPVVPYALEEPVFSIFAVLEMIGRALTASVRNLLGPAIVTLGYVVISMVRRRRNVIA